MVKSKNPLQLDHLLKHQLEEASYTPSAYSMAWAARLEDEFGEPLFPMALLWLHANQNEDGSWGNTPLSLTYYSDRIITTFMALIVLKEWSNRGLLDFDEEIELGLSYLREQVEGDLLEHYFPIGFGEVLPRLFAEAKSVGLFSEEEAGVLEHAFASLGISLKHHREGYLAEPSLTQLYTLEGLSPLSLNWEKVLELQNREGGYLASPAAAAYTYLHTGNQQSLAYLQHIWAEFGFMPEVLFD
ncbi:MAG: hypothetical protein AAF798_22285 [Bacteroidota bacterium]